MSARVRMAYVHHAMSVDLQKKLGHRVSTLRKARGLTQEQLAERCGFTSKSISEIERGRVNVPLVTLGTIAKNLGATISEVTLGIEGALPREVRSLDQLLAGKPRKEHAAIAKVLTAMSEWSELSRVVDKSD